MCLDADLILPSPSWVTYQPQAQMLGRRALWVQTSLASDWKLSPQVLDKALDQHSQYSYSYPRLLVLNSPSNPTGVAYTDQELAALATVCRKHNVMVLSDEIYGRLTYRVSPEQAKTDGSREGSDRPGHAHASIARHLPESTIVLDGISKWAGAGGWRLGAFCFPKEMHWLRQAMMAAASETFSSVSAPIQHAAIPAFAKDQEPAMAEYLATANRILRLVSSFQTTSLLQAGAEARMPHGGFYCFPDFSRTPAVSSGAPRTSVELSADILKQTGVAMLPGTAFGRLPSEPTFRLAFVDFDGAKAMDAIDQDKRFNSMLPDWTETGGEAQQLQRDFLEEFCGPVFHGTNALCSYLGEPSRA
jgi:aspartate aminotransferase